MSNLEDDDDYLGTVSDGGVVQGGMNRRRRAYGYFRSHRKVAPSPVKLRAVELAEPIYFTLTVIPPNDFYGICGSDWEQGWKVEDNDGLPMYRCRHGHLRPDIPFCECWYRELQAIA